MGSEEDLEKLSAVDGEPVIVEAPIAVAPQELPDTAPTMTADRAFASRADPLMRAFLVEEHLKGGEVRKLTRAKWNAELEDFKQRPRG
jgi:hypothetical protein